MKRILILHGSSFVSRATTLSLLHGFSTRDDIEAHYHHIMAPVTEDLRKAAFDMIFINYCFFMSRQASYQDHIIGCYDWVADHPAVKVAFPMDDCYRSAYIEEWIKFLGARIVYTALFDYKEKIYPHLVGEADIRPALTGYVDNSLLSRVAQYRRPLEERPIMLGSRVARSPASHGAFAGAKADYATGAARLANERGLSTDVSTRPEDAFVNMDWFDFLGRCRSTPTMKGGYGLIDPQGKYREASDRFVRENPGASYEQVAAQAFPDADHRAEYSCISPRIFECAMMHTVQLMPPSNYLECLAPWRHYIPLERDFSNSGECFNALRDVKLCKEIAESCYDTLIETGWFTERSLIDDVLSHVPERTEPASVRLSSYKRNVDSVRKQKEIMGRWKRMTVAYMFLYARLHKAEQLLADCVWWLKNHGHLLDSDLNRHRLKEHRKLWFAHSYIAQLNVLAGLDKFDTVRECFSRLPERYTPLNVYWPWAFSGETPFVAELDQIYKDPSDLAMDRYKFDDVESELDAQPSDPDFHVKRATLAAFKWAKGLPTESQSIMIEALKVPPRKRDKASRDAYNGMGAALLAFAPRATNKEQLLTHLSAFAERFSDRRIDNEIQRLNKA